MQLDYNEVNQTFVLRVKRAEADVGALMLEHGLDFSTPASTKTEAVLFTREPYAAAAFALDYGTKRAKAVLGPILVQIEASRAPVGTGHYPVPYGKELWPFQVADLDYARQRTNTLVGDEPGLGKTQIAIAWANEIQAKRVLVICPAAIRKQWVERIQEWTTMPYPYHVHMIRNSKDGTHPWANWTVVSYELSRTEAIGRGLAAYHYDLLILDEGHYLKTVDTRRTRAVFGGGDAPLFAPLASLATHSLALTGTPLPNRPREAYTLARGLCFDAIDWMSEDRFRERFNPSQRIERIDPATGRTKFYVDERSGRHWELQSRLRANFMTRHSKREVMPQLKMPVYDLIQLEETAAVKQALAAERLLDIDPEDLTGADIEVMGDIATVRKEMGIALAPQVAEYVNMLIDGGETKLVVFGWHIEVLNMLERAWQKHGVTRFIAGSQANDARKQRFIKDPGCHIILGNVLTLGTGTDGLQDVAWHALIAEPDWTPGNNIQCFDRLDRGGQTRTVQGDIFVAPGSFAEKVLASALRKLQTTDRALDRRV